MKTTRWSMMFAVGLVGVVASLACAQSYDELRWQAERLRRDRDAVEARYAGALQAQARARADLDAASADMARADGRGEVPQREQSAADLSDMRQRLDVAVAMATLDAMLTEP